MFRQLAPVTLLVIYTSNDGVRHQRLWHFVLCLEIKMKPINTIHPHFESPTYSPYILCSAIFGVYFFQSNH